MLLLQDHHSTTIQSNNPQTTQTHNHTVELLCLQLEPAQFSLTWTPRFLSAFCQLFFAIWLEPRCFAADICSIFSTNFLNAPSKLVVPATIQTKTSLLKSLPKFNSALPTAH
jgi:hypothetical protein